MNKISSFPIFLQKRPCLHTMIALTCYVERRNIDIYLKDHKNTIHLKDLIDQIFFFFYLNLQERLIIMIEGNHTFKDIQNIISILNKKERQQTF